MLRRDIFIFYAWTTFSVMVVLCGCEKSRPKETVIRMSAASLWRAYRLDPSSADKKYDGELIEVSGVVNHWLNGQPFFNFADDDEPRQGIHCHMGGVEVLNRGKVRRASKEGRTVTIRGRCSGWDGDNVDLNDCRCVG